MERFASLKENLSYLSADQIDDIERAYLLAAQAHSGQKRRTGEDYIVHPLAVARILAEMHMDPGSLKAGLLHDTIEDTLLTKEQISEHFDEELAELVDGLSKLNKLEERSRAEAQAENFRKMLLAMSKDIRVIIVKLADRLHNMRTIHALKREQQQRIAQETLEIFAPVARRMGMHGISLELEDLSFMALYPRRYEILQKSVLQVQGDHYDVLKDIMQTVRNRLVEQQVDVVDISSREKHLYSIYRKMQRKRIPFSEVTDVYAIRIVTETVDGCYRALGVVHGLYKPVPDKFKDYIALPKPNDYQSLHTVLFGPYGLPIEVQIRTRAMDQMADHGISAHWAYKAGAHADTPQLERQEWLQRLIDIQRRTGNSLEFIENVKIDLYPDQVYVFTPEATIMELPVGSTAMDFAYAVHTDIGNSCVAAKIDRQLAPLSTVLANGQTVEIITAPGAHPSPAWLNFVVTGKAKSSIRHYLKTQQHDESVALGKQMLEKALLPLEQDLAGFSAEQQVALAQDLRFQNFDDVLEDIGLGNRAAIFVAQRMAVLDGHEILVVDDIPSPAMPLAITGTEGMVVEYASCCRPIPGDPIMGVLNAGHGVSIHKEDCERLLTFRHQTEKCVALCWASDVSGEFLVHVDIDVVNKRGVLAMLALAIADARGNIEDIQVGDRDSETTRVTVLVGVTSRVHLAQVFRHIRSVGYVKKVRRRTSS